MWRRSREVQFRLELKESLGLRKTPQNKCVAWGLHPSPSIRICDELLDLGSQAKEAAKHMAKQFQLEDGVAGADSSSMETKVKILGEGTHGHHRKI